MKELLTEYDKAKIEKVVKAAEAGTTGEIVPFIARSSSDYKATKILSVNIISMVLATTITIGMGILGFFSQWGPVNLSFMDFLPGLFMYLILFMTFYVIAYPLSSYFPTLYRFFLSKKQLKEEIKESAITAFYVNELNKTKQQNGVIIYVSVFEKMVWVLGDSGIHSLAGESAFQKIADTLGSNIKNGDLCDAICTAVTETGDLLAVHYPPSKTDTNELPNLVVEK